MKKSQRKYFGALDIVVVLVVIVSAVFSLLSQFNTDDSSLECVVRYNGDVVFTQPLSAVNDRIEKQIDGDLTLVVVIDDDSVFVTQTQCPDKLCEHTGQISRAGQSIVCLPAKISVSLESTDAQLDVVVG